MFHVIGHAPYFVVSYESMTYQDLECYMAHIGQSVQRIDPDEFLSSSSVPQGSYMNLVHMIHHTDRSKIYQHMADLDCERFSFTGSFIPQASQLDGGCFVYPNVSILPNSHVGKDVILHEGTVVGHYAMVGDGTFTSMNVSIAGKANIGNFCWIGADVTIADKVDIADHTTILMRSIVTRSITNTHTTYQKHR